MNTALEHLALPRSQRALCSHDTVPLRSTCCSDRGQQMFQLHSDLKKHDYWFGRKSLPESIMLFALNCESAQLQFVLLLKMAGSGRSFCEALEAVSYFSWDISDLRRRVNTNTLEPFILPCSIVCLFHWHQQFTSIWDINHILLSNDDNTGIYHGKVVFFL